MSRSYIQLLDDAKFLEWRMAPNEELNAYWDSLQQQDPSLQKMIVQADLYLKEFISDKRSFNNADKEFLLESIFKTIEDQANRKLTCNRKTITWQKYVAAASAILILATSILFFTKEKSSDADVITGSQLDTDQIQLVSGDKLFQFEENIDIQINESSFEVTTSAGTNELSLDANSVNKLTVPYGKQSKIRLPDGSLVWLNAGSTLEFPSTFGNAQREIKLTGEIYIEVATDRKKRFMVQTPDFTVEATGTAFNVSAYEKAELSAVLVEGKISVHTEGHVTEMKPNELAIIDRTGKIETKTVNTESYTSWINGYLTFEDTPITRVLAHIERYYNIEFDYLDNPNFQDVTCTGKLYLTENLDHIMRSVTLMTNTEYTLNDKTIIISKKARQKTPQ